MLFLSREKTEVQICVFVCMFNASGDETPTESSTTSLNALRQVCYSAAVSPRALSQNFAFWVSVETSKLAIYVLKVCDETKTWIVSRVPDKSSQTY